MIETRYHFVSIDSVNNLSAVDLRLSLDPDVTGVVIEHAAAPAFAADLEGPPTGYTRYWWRVLVGPGELLDPTGLPEPLVGHGVLVTDPETTGYQWVLGDPTPDELPDFASDCWPVVIREQDAQTFAAFASDIQELAKASAVATLRQLTGTIVGGCPVEVRPCRAGCSASTWRAYPVAGRGSWSPAYVDGRWLNIGCGVQHGPLGCSCRGVSAVRLPPPVGRIDAVWVDGVELAADSYRLYGSSLLRTDGDVWPLSQNLALPHTDADTFAIVYLNAYPVDALGSFAAGVLAVEYAKSYTGQACRLPANATQVQRAGTTVQLDKRKQSQTAAFPDGLTGLKEVDAFIQRYNPHGLKTRSSVWSPDVASSVR